MANYDPKIIQQFADSLYARASSVVVFYTLLGAAFGYVASFYLRELLFVFVSAKYGQLACVAAFAVIGFLIGRNKAFLLKLQAQTALCQAKIESNTSGSSAT